MSRLDVKNKKMLNARANKQRKQGILEAQVKAGFGKCAEKAFDNLVSSSKSK